MPDDCDAPWDADGDGSTTRTDYALLVVCLRDPCPSVGCDPGAHAPTIADASIPVCCGLADVDDDGDVDLRDFAVHARMMGGPAE